MGPRACIFWVEMRFDERALRTLNAAEIEGLRAVAAREEDFGKEFLALVAAVKVVDSSAEAIGHIERYGSGHSEAIVTRDYARARRFVQVVDAACVLVNASTRLCDGGQFGMGAELGISTSKLHARGPVGVEELTTTKFVVFGSGQVRE